MKAKNITIIRESIEDQDVVKVQDEFSALLLQTEPIHFDQHSEFELNGLKFLVLPEAKELGEEKVFINFASLKKFINEK